MAYTLVSMQSNEYLFHRRHVAVHQAYEQDYVLHKSAEQLEGCPEFFIKDDGFDRSYLLPVAGLVSPPIPFNRDHM